MDNAKLGNEIYKVIYLNPDYVHITEQMDDVYKKQIALQKKLNAQINSLEIEYAGLSNKRLLLRNILRNKAIAAYRKNFKRV